MICDPSVQMDTILHITFIGSIAYIRLSKTKCTQTWFFKVQVSSKFSANLTLLEYNMTSLNMVTVWHRDGRFDSKVGQIGHQIGQIGTNLTHFRVKPTIPGMRIVAKVVVRLMLFWFQYVTINKITRLSYWWYDTCLYNYFWSDTCLYNYFWSDTCSYQLLLLILYMFMYTWWDESCQYTETKAWASINDRIPLPCSHSYRVDKTLGHRFLEVNENKRQK